MNIVFVGGGSLRLLPILRGVFETPEILRGGSIRLVDSRVERAEAVGRMLLACPEYKNVGCEVIWTGDLDRALDGADVFYMTMAATRQPSQARAKKLSEQYRYICSDQLSLNGAFLAARLGPVAMEFARKMEKYCPGALMLIFSNPVAVYSAAVNNHTAINALGICGGFANHRWDLSRICGRDEFDKGWNVACAGVNHCSFILRGDYNGRDYREMLADALTADWKMIALPTMGEAEERCRRTLVRMVDGYKRFGSMIFSSEGDGVDHVFYADARARIAEEAEPGEVDFDAITQRVFDRIENSFAEFGKYASGELLPDWDIDNPRCGIRRTDITIPILKAVAGLRPMHIAASRPNRGAIADMPYNAAVEYSMKIAGRNITPDPDLYIPSPFKGLIGSLSEFQTLLSDAIALRDPKLFADALEAYPMHRGEAERTQYVKELFDIYDDIDPELKKAIDFIEW